MPPVNDSNNIPGSAGGPLVNGNSAGNNSSNDNDKTASIRKFTFPSHQFHMVHLAKMCQENKEYTDCVIRVGNADGQQDQELRAHRLVLGSVSPFLKLVFADLPQNHSEATILVPGVHRRVVKALLDFFYTGQMTVERQDTTDLQLLIDTLQIDPGLITVDTVSKNEQPPTSAGNVAGSTKPETDTVTTTTTTTAPPPNKKNEKSRETPPSPNKPETSVTVDTNKKPNHETDSDESQKSQNSDFFGRMIDRKRKANEDHDDREFSSKKRIADTNDSEGDEEASK